MEEEDDDDDDEVKIVSVKKVKVTQIRMDFARTAGGNRFVHADPDTWEGIKWS